MSETTSPSQRRVVLITGMSGAGVSTALKALEDQGYEAVDNLPLSLVDAFIQQSAPQGRASALVIDTRNRAFSAAAVCDLMESLRRRPDIAPQLLFLDCDDDVLQRRFTETRRRHPLAIDRPVIDGLFLERQMLATLKEKADLVLDTSRLSIHDLRRLVTTQYRLDARDPLHVFVMSFSFRAGLPREADLVFDVRFLDNPHYDPALRPLTGLHPAVAAKVAADPDYPAFFERLTALVAPLLPRYSREGKSYLTIAVGCTGGKHRSVFVAEELGKWLMAQGYHAGILHREMPTFAPTPAPAAAQDKDAQ